MRLQAHYKMTDYGQVFKDDAPGAGSLFPDAEVDYYILSNDSFKKEFKTLEELVMFVAVSESSEPIEFNLRWEEEQRFIDLMRTLCMDKQEDKEKKDPNNADS